jgi:hypothetical protein
MTDQHIFISYARKDGSEHAAKFDAELHRRKFKTWRDKRGIDPTQDFTAEIENAIEAASHVVVCITPDVRREDSFVRREIQFALLCEKPIYVARFADVKPPISVVNNTWLDFFKGWESPFEQLCTLLKTTDYVIPTPEHSDPYKPYLDALYKQIVNYLDKTVFSSLPGMTNTPLLELTGDLTPEAVDAAHSLQPTIELNALPMAFYDLAGVDNDAVGTQHVASSPEPYKNFHDAFERYDGRVLLLGEPGGGKTTTLFAFARDKVAERLEQPDKPLPILVPIVTWNAEAQTPLDEWLAQAVTMLKDDVAGILREGKALLLLDGLDELGAEREDSKTKEKYDPRLRFMSVTPTNNQLLVTCRVKDYEEIGAKLALQGAVTLKPLDDAQMKAYLRDLPELWNVLENDNDLRDVARIPLLLSFFAYAFAGLDKEAKALGDLSRGDVRDKIFEIYIIRRYKWEERRVKARGETLPFSLDKMWEILAEIAYRSLPDVFRENYILLLNEVNVIVRDHFVELLHSEIDLDKFLQFAIQLHLLVPITKLTYSQPHPLLFDAGETTYRFTHLLLHDHFAFAIALKRLTDRDADIRFTAAEVLGKLKDARTVEPLIIALSDSDANVRLGVATALGELKDMRAVEPLIAALSDSDDNVRSRVATALGELKDMRAVEPLITALWNSKSEITGSRTMRHRIVRTLIELGGDRTIESMIPLLQDSDADLRSRAADVLGELGDERAVPPLIAALDDSNRIVRSVVALALSRIHTAKAIEAVEKWKRGNRG